MTEPRASIVPCPACGGAGRIPAFRPSGRKRDGSPRRDRCAACGGSGGVLPDRADAIRLGVVCREIRRESGVELSAMARRLGVTSWELARFEAGVERSEIVVAQIVRAMAAIRRAADAAKRSEAHDPRAGGPGGSRQ